MIWIFRKGVENSLLFYLLLFLSCVNFLGRGPVVFLFVGLYGLYLSWSFNAKWNVSSVCYLLMAFTAMVSSAIYFDVTEIIKPLVYFFSFYVAYRCYKVARDKELFVQRTVFAACLGFVLNLAVNYYTNKIVMGNMTGVRILVDFWTLKPLPVTIYGMMSCIPIAYSFYCLLGQKNLYLKLFSLCSLVLVSVFNMETATRTPFVMFALVYIVMFWEYFSSKHIKHKWRTFSILVLIIVAVIYRFAPVVADSPIVSRFEDSGMKTSRVDITEKFINLMPDYLWGGLHITEKTGRLAHNFILESYDTYGFFFLLFYIIILLCMFRRIWCLHRIKNKKGIDFLLLSLYLALNVQALLEPIIMGYPQVIWFLFMIDGMAMAYLYERKYCIR